VRRKKKQTYKFVLFSLTDPAGKSVSAAAENIADAVTHARFVGTDQASDGVVLMKILQVVAFNFKDQCSLPSYHHSTKDTVKHNFTSSFVWL
jgi:hypothetical protein